jgi:phosphoglycolate phosphatase-like HAD superfamily hydrolase
MKCFAIYNREEITCILEKGDADDTDTRIILDVDGTFIDSNDAHAKSWAEAMAVYGYNVAFEKVLPQIIHLQKDSGIGSQISKRREAIFKERYSPPLAGFSRR